MKKLLAIALLLSVLSLAAVSINYNWKSGKAPQLTLLDSASIFNLEAMLKVKPTDASLAEATRLYLMAQLDNDIASRERTYFLSLRTFPLSDVYDRYVSDINETHPDRDFSVLHDFADTLRLNVTTKEYISAARYTLNRRDTSATVALLNWCMTNDTAAFRIVDKDEAFRRLDNCPEYYYMMDYHVNRDPAIGYQSSLRTLRFTEIASLPFAVNLAILDKNYEYKEDTINGEYHSTSPYALRDDAMRDFVKADRFGRFSRETDHSVQYVATLHLSDKFYTYVYSIQDWGGMSMMEEQVASDTLPDSLENFTKEVALPSETEPKEEAQPESVQAVPAPMAPANEIHIVNVDKYGKKIADQQIACTCSPIHISTATIDKNGLITVTDQEQKWAKDPLTAGYEKNEVIRRDVTAITRYKVTAKGEIVASTDGATAKAQ